MKAADICRKYDISNTTYDKWKNKYGCVEVDEESG